MSLAGASPKRQRQYEHIKESSLKRGRDIKTAERIAAATTNKTRAQKGESKTASEKSLKDENPSVKGGRIGGSKGGKAAAASRKRGGATRGTKKGEATKKPKTERSEKMEETSKKESKRGTSAGGKGGKAEEKGTAKGKKSTAGEKGAMARGKKAKTSLTQKSTRKSSSDITAGKATAKGRQSLKKETGARPTAEKMTENMRGMRGAQQKKARQGAIQRARGKGGEGERQKPKMMAESE